MPGKPIQHLVWGLLFFIFCAAGSHIASAQDVFSSGSQGSGSPGGDEFNGGEGADDFGANVPPGDCTGIDRIWSNGRCNPRSLPGYTNCGPYYNSYQYFVEATLKHLGGACEIRGGNQLWCHQRQPGMCNPGAGGRPDSPLMDSGTRLTQNCQTVCDPTVGQSRPASHGTVPVTAEPATDCIPVPSSLDQQIAKAVAADARQIAVQTVMGTGSFLEGSAQVIDEYAHFMAQPPGVPASKTWEGLVQLGAAVTDYWNNEDPKKDDALWTAAGKAVDQFRQNPARNLGAVAGNVLLIYGGNGLCKVGGRASGLLSQRIQQAKAAVTKMQGVEKAGEGFAKATTEGGEGAGAPAAGGQEPSGGYGNGSGDQPSPAGQTPTPSGSNGQPVNDAGLNTNCPQCTIAGLLRMMGRGMPNASDIFVSPGQKVLDAPKVYELLAKYFGKTPPKYLSADLLKLHRQGIPFLVDSLDDLGKVLGDIVKNGGAGPGVNPKVVIFIENQPPMSAAPGGLKLSTQPRPILGGKIMQTPPRGVGHIIAAIQKPSGLALSDFQNEVHDTNLIEQMFLRAPNSTTLPPKLYVYPVE